MASLYLLLPALTSIVVSLILSVNSSVLIPEIRFKKRFASLADYVDLDAKIKKRKQKLIYTFVKNRISLPFYIYFWLKRK